MSVEGFSRIIPNSTSMLAPISDWGTSLIAPLGSSLLSKDGMFGLAGKVYLIVGGLLIAAVIIARKYGYLTGRAVSNEQQQLDLINKIELLVEQIENEALKKQLGQVLNQKPLVAQLGQEIEQIGVFYGKDSDNKLVKCIDEIIKERFKHLNFVNAPLPNDKKFKVSLFFATLATPRFNAFYGDDVQLKKCKDYSEQVFLIAAWGWAKPIYSSRVAGFIEGIKEIFNFGVADGQFHPEGCDDNNDREIERLGKLLPQKDT